MLDEESVIALAVAHRLGLTMKPIGLDTGDVFVIGQSYRTGELLAFAEALLAAWRERCAKACEAVNAGNSYKNSPLGCAKAIRELEP